MPAAASAELREFLTFLDASPTPYHAVRSVRERLVQAGFTPFAEGDAWQVTPGTCGFVQRGGSLLAFVAGNEAPSDAGFIVLGAHTDSPNLRLKPSPELSHAGYRQAAIEIYGGVLFTTWLDRDLGLAGRVALAGGRHELVRLEGAPFRIPNLAIHLNRDVNKEGLVVNPQHHLAPVWGLESSETRTLMDLVVAALDTTPSAGAGLVDIVGFDLCFFDGQAASIGGAAGELISSGRLDNLGSCAPIVAALIDARAAGATTRVIALHDHEEVGSQSAAGARSPLLESVLDRLAFGYHGAGPDALHRAVARSLFVSADMAHAVHPNYADKHDKLHRPLLGGGPVVKVNASQSYATDAVAQGAFVEACRAEGVAPQFFVSRNDQPCGSTIGPITAARLGMRALDIGNPMLAMHSCRETAGSADAASMRRVLCRMLLEPPLRDPAA